MYFDINKYAGKYVMHCKNKEELKSFIAYLTATGHQDKAPYHDSSCYYGKNVYYFNQNAWSSIEYAKQEKYTILEWEDFMKNTFTKADLKTGDVVLRRNGDVEIVNRELQMFIRKNGWTDLNDINADLASTLGGKDWDIVSVRRPLHKSDCLFDAFEKEFGALVYKRQEVEEMTLEQVCKLLGKEIKIIK